MCHDIYAAMNGVFSGDGQNGMVADCVFAFIFFVCCARGGVCHFSRGFDRAALYGTTHEDSIDHRFV